MFLFPCNLKLLTFAIPKKFEKRRERKENKKLAPRLLRKHLIFSLWQPILGWTISLLWVEVVTQLGERSLPTPEVHGSSPVIGKIYIEHVMSRLLKRHKKRPGMAHLFKKTCSPFLSFIVSWTSIVKTRQTDPSTGSFLP